MIQKTTLIILSILLFSTVLNAQDAGAPGGKQTEPPKINTRPAPTPSPVKGNVLLFPEIEGWTKSEKTVYPVPALGYSYTYESNSGGRVTIYVYNGGKRTIPNDVNDPVVKREFENVKNEVFAAEQLGYYQNVKVVKSSVETIGASTKCQYGLLNFTVRGNKVVSEIYLFAYDNNFIKLRATRAPDKADDDEFNTLLTELAAMFE